MLIDTSGSFPESFAHFPGGRIVGGPGLAYRESPTDAWTLPLSQEPVVESLAVTVDGSLTTAWAYDSASNAVTIGGLAGGETLSATYTIATGCN